MVLRVRSLPLLIALIALLARATAQTCGNIEETTQHNLATPDGRDRFYLKYKPSGIATASNYPLVIELHGLSACATNLYSYSGWKVKADENTFILVTPQGVSRSWNAGRCCGQPREAKLDVDDVSFLRTVARQVIEAEPGIDPTRIYFAGHSTGCMMAQRMAIEASDLVAAVACHSGMLFAPPSSPASDSIATPSGYMPVPVMEIHGLEDRTVSFDYDTILGAPYWPGALRNLGWWRQLNGCPAASPTITSYDSYSIYLHSGCTGGSQAVLIEVPTAGHYPFLSYPPYVDTTQLAWNFVQQFSMPLPPSSPPLWSPSSPSPSPSPPPAPPSPPLPMSLRSSPRGGGEGAPVHLIAGLIGAAVALAVLGLAGRLVISRRRSSMAKEQGGGGGHVGTRRENLPTGGPAHRSPITIEMVNSSPL